MSDLPEFDALELAVATARGVFAARALTIVELHDEIDRLVADNAAQDEANSALMHDNLALTSEVARLQAIIDGGTPPPPPPPPVRTTLLGVSGSTTVPGACDRIFYTGNRTVAQRTAGAPRVHVSWKVLGDAPLTDDQFVAVVANLRDGDKVEYEHETDAKWRKDGNAANLAARLKAKNALFDQVKRLRDAGRIAKLDVVNTLTSYAFEGKLFADVTKYDAKADVLGADLDGGAFPHDYAEPKRLANIVAHAKAHYGGRFTVPEFGWNNDPAGGRMGTITAQIAAIAKTGPEEIQYHNNPAFGATLTAAELAEMAKLVKQYNG